MAVPLHSAGASIEVHEADEYSALYLNGELTIHSKNSYHIDEWIREYFGVRTVQDDAFMMGTGDQPLAKTLDQVCLYREERQERRDEAAAMREQANELLDRAKRLEEGIQ